MMLTSILVAGALAVVTPQGAVSTSQSSGPETASQSRVVGIGGGGERWVERRKAWLAFSAELGEPTRTFLSSLGWLRGSAPEQGLWQPVEAPSRDVRATGLALLAMAGLGDTPVDGDSRTAMKLTMMALTERVDEVTGELLDADRRPVPLEDHAIGTLALGEVWHAMKAPILRKKADVATARLVEAALAEGAFRSDGADGAQVLELDRLAWTVHALAEAQDMDLAVDPLVFERALKELDAFTDTRAGRLDAGRGVADEGLRARVLVRDTAVALYARVRALAALERETRPALAEVAALDVASAIPRGRFDDGVDHAFCLFGTLADGTAGWPHGKAWFRAIEDVPARRRIRDGDDEGSFEPRSAEEPPAGRVEATAMNLLWIEAAFDRGE
jgi:hypothetical protein